MKIIRALLGWIGKIRLGLCRLLAKRRGGVYYIGGSETLPPPLSHEEEAVILEKLTADGVESEEDRKLRRVLVERNLRLVVYIAKKFDNTGIGIEDLISIGSIGLMKAAKTFDPTKNIKLATYASRCIENEILMFIRKTGNLKSEVSIDEPLSVDWDGNELLLSDVLCAEEDGISRGLDHEEDRRQIREALYNLSERERRIIVLRFGLGGIITAEEREKLLEGLPTCFRGAAFTERTRRRRSPILLGISSPNLAARKAHPLRDEKGAGRELLIILLIWNFLARTASLIMY